jgi:hypothetical protein
MTAFFSRTDKKVRLSDYLASARQKKAQTPDEMLAALMGMREAGAPINIRDIN